MDVTAPANGTTSALVLIEYQHDFTATGGMQHEAVRTVMAHTDMMRSNRACWTASAPVASPSCRHRLR